MAKRTYEERKDELSKKQIAYLEKANNLKEQIKELEKKQAEENRRKRNHRLIEVQQLNQFWENLLKKMTYLN